MGSSTKEQERMALEQIKTILAGLGTDSYIATALEGCLEIAEENITNDFACSMKQNLESAEKDLQEKTLKLSEAEKNIEALEAIIRNLQERLEIEEEWTDYQTDELSDADYERLKESCGSKSLTNSEAKCFVSNEYGFDESKIEILRELRQYEVNRHRRLRYKATTERNPYYFASDYHYVRFVCCGCTYEVKDGDLYKV